MTPAALQPLVADLETDLRERATSHGPTRTQLAEDHAAAREAGRTAATLSQFVEAEATQAAVAWVLSCVFVRHLEDTELIDPVLSGPGGAEITGRHHAAGDTRDAWFREHPAASDRDYLLQVFATLDAHPGTGGVFGDHNALAVRPDWASGEAIGRLVAAFRALDPDTGELKLAFAPEEDAPGEAAIEEESGLLGATSKDDDTPTHADRGSPGRRPKPSGLDPRSGSGTRFLGDLYQDLSEYAKKRYALLQTPHFVESFILDRTLTPALEAFGLTPDGEAIRILDPACGSGHFLLGAFPRLLEAWERHAPAMSRQERVIKALASLHGVDLNPYAVAISRFRLSLAALAANGDTRLADAPDWHLNLACGDALLHGGRPDSIGFPTRDAFAYGTEDPALLRRILQPSRYHAVVANPPYITVKDKKQNAAIRERYESCSGKYALSVPFMERIFDLAKEPSPGSPAGFTGQITSNSFMKREFGKKLVREHVKGWTLTHVIDTSGAYLPGHGTPTVILFGRPGRSQAPGSADREQEVRAVLGIRGEPTTPADPAKGEVWTAIVGQVDEPGSESEWVSVEDSPREAFEDHPWSVTGGGASKLKQQIEDASEEVLDDSSTSIGFASFTGLDDAFVADRDSFLRRGFPADRVQDFVYGETVRDWTIEAEESAFAPYDDKFEPLSLDPDADWAKALWPLRLSLGSVISFAGRTRTECGDDWWTWYRWVAEKYRTQMSITFAEVATHNHFVLDRGGKVFKQTAPVIKLPPDATQDDHLALLGLLNSSTANFLSRQNGHCKGGGGIGGGIASEEWEQFYVRNGTQMKQFPLPQAEPHPRTVDLARQLDATVRGFSVEACLDGEAAHEAELDAAHHRMIALQEELDWRVYALYGLINAAPGEPVWSSDLLGPDDPPATRFGERAFEVRMAREGVSTTWFSRHNATPTTDLPESWPQAHRDLVERRIAAINENPRTLGLLERPEHKRRWNRTPFAKQKQDALRRALLLRLETLFDDTGRMLGVVHRPRRCTSGEAAALSSSPEEPHAEALAAPTRSPYTVGDGEPHRAGGGEKALKGLLPTAAVAEAAALDPGFPRLAAAYTGTSAPDLDALVRELMDAESIPGAAALRFKPSGLRKHADWLTTWNLQRREDQGEPVGDIPVPPKYKSTDFKKASFWKLRGKLDVPKERWVSFPAAGRNQETVYAWAGLDHAQLGTALAEHLGHLRESGLTPPDNLLAALHELLPWIAQWHPEVDPEYGETLAVSLTALLTETLASLGKTLVDLAP